SDHDDIVAQVRTIVGPTDPAKADPNTIRGRFGTDTMEKSKSEKRLLRNLIHASDSDENAQKELELWFK
ncbi:MAG: nucleoside-diphosphate kinase, partial [Erysipelotrichaceae bacterium]